MIGRGAAAQNPECWDLAVKESSDSEPRRGAGEAEGEGGGWVQKNCAPRSIVFSSRFARARVSLSCESALPCSGRRCVCASVSLVSVGAPRHVPALPAWGKTSGCSATRAACAFGGLSANQRRRNKILSSCAVDKSPSYSLKEIKRMPPAGRALLIDHPSKARER